MVASSSPSLVGPGSTAWSGQPGNLSRALRRQAVGDHHPGRPPMADGDHPNAASGTVAMT
jgi:hypothetical protein